MKLYEIDEAIMGLVDEETGEITDFEAFDKLQMERESKIESVALYRKNLMAEAAALKAEKDAFAERQRIAENKAARLDEYLKHILQGQKFSTERCQVNFRKTEVVKVNDDEAAVRYLEQFHEDLLKYSEPTYSKVEVKKLIKSGEAIPGVEIEAGLSVGVK